MRSNWIALLIVLATLLLIIGNSNPNGIWAQDKEESTPPKVTKIVLYKHGMGYFEREEKVKDNTTVTLGFKTNEMKDILTSFFAVDQNGGKITTVGYDSKDPIEKQLENILIRVPEGAALTQFLAQLKGAKVEVKIGNDTARGNILGIEPISQKVDNMAVTAYKFVLLTEGGEIKPFNLLEVTSLKLLDEPIQKDLKRVLDIYLNAKYTDRKQVTLNCTGNGERDILMGYLVEMPIWKTSYRLILDEKEKPFLQGWAIVENPTDEDWENVQMSFVAGNPISFSMDLYTSYYPQRPVVNLASIIPAGGLFNAIAMAEPPAEAPLMKAMETMDKENGEYASEGDGKDFKGGRGGRAGAMRAPMSALLQSSISSLASGVQIGELFAYESKTPVSIGRRKAAMVPIITEKAEGNKILYYRATISPRLMNAFYLTNSTKLTLEAGPVTLFEGSTSVGEAFLKQPLQAGMKEILPYAIETGCLMEITSQYQSKPIHRCRITSGVLVATNYNINETVYKLTNKTARNQVVYLDHPRTANYTLINPEKAEEEVPGYYRFKMDLAAGKSVEFKVQEQVETASQIYLQSISLDQIRYYLSEAPLSNEAKALLKDLTDLMNQLADEQRVYNEAQVEQRNLAVEEERIRQNIGILRTDDPKERDRREKNLEKIDKIDERIEVLKGTMSSAQDKATQLREALIQKIQSLNEK